MRNELPRQYYNFDVALLVMIWRYSHFVGLAAFRVGFRPPSPELEDYNHTGLRAAVASASSIRAPLQQSRQRPRSVHFQGPQSRFRVARRRLRPRRRYHRRQSRFRRGTSEPGQGVAQGIDRRHRRVDGRATSRRSVGGAGRQTKQFLELARGGADGRRAVVREVLACHRRRWFVNIGPPLEGLLRFAAAGPPIALLIVVLRTWRIVVAPRVVSRTGLLISCFARSPAWIVGHMIWRAQSPRGGWGTGSVSPTCPCKT